MPIPEQYRKQLEQQRQLAEVRSQLSKQYDKEMASKYTKDMPSYAQWLTQRQQPKAKGGSVMGINVASDRKSGRRYADMIVDGHKTLESRNSDTLRPYVGKRVAIVRTGEGKAKAIGEVTIGEPMVVNKQKFRALEDKHHVPEGSAFDINTPTKHLYPMHDPVRYDEERDVGHGIVSRKVIEKAKGGTVKEPKSTVKAYKLFRVHPDHPGKLFPLFVDANTPVEMNKWVDAKEGEMKGNKVKSKIGDLAYRPGWHAGDLPIATHIGEKSDPKLTAPDRRPANHAWAEVEMPDDVDWQSEATKRGTNAQGKVVPVKAHITDQIPKGGHYRYKTNPNMTGNWLIGGSMKVNKVLSDAEVSRINKSAGMSDLPRAQPFKKKEFGFAKGGTVAPDEWKAEEHVNYAKGKEITNPFDYENADHVETVSEIAAKHKDFSKIPDVAKHLASTLSTGNWRHIEDPRIQDAIKQAGHDGYHVAEKHGKEAHVSRKADGGAVEDDYRSSHQAPGPHFGAPMHDVSGNGMYPKDFYSPNGLRYYADHTDPSDRDAYNKVTRVKGKPDDMVSIHRAIPTKVYNEALKKDAPLKHMIRKGDWVAINKDYAKDHGEAVLLGDYKIASMRVPAKHVWTNADSIHEWGYHPEEKSTGEITHKAKGGYVQPSLAKMKLALAQKSSSVDLKNVGVNEAPNMSPKHFFPPETSDIGFPSPGGVATTRGMPIGGVDMSQQQGGQQLMPTPPQPPQGAPGQPPGAPGAPPPPGGPAGAPMGAPQGPTPPPGNMLSMTPQGQTMNALGGQRMAKGGQPSVDQMKAELAAKKAPASDSQDDDEEDTPAPSKRITIKADGPGGVTGIVVPHHMLHGRSWINKKGKKVVVPGMKDINKARAEVYGSENRDPLSIGQIGKIHKDTLTEHFAKSPKEQLAAEKEATQRLRDAKHLGAKNNTLDESEKLDTVRHETDEEGRTHVGFASKGVAGHALYTSGHGDNMKYHVINTCPGQTEGCGGGKDSKGVVDTSKGTCFAPNAESQYVHAAVRRATHEQAKHDPKMTRDWILAHTGSMREAAKKADKSNQRLLFRPNVVDETDVSSRHAIRHLNEQRKEEGKPDIIANSYGKTNELHDPENGYYVTHSNVGPKVKKGQEIAENVGRDKARVRNTVMAADNRGDFKNEQGNKTPPKGSYMVTDVKRNSPMSKKMEEHITHAKYWTTGRSENELSADEKDEGPEGHFSGSGRRTSEDKAHYGHTTIEGKRFDYQKQHILHPRLVNVPIRKKNKKTGEMETKDHMIPTDSRFKDTEFLPKDRFKTKNGKEAGHILMTTPTESTSNVGHETSFTHHVSPKHIEHAMKNNGEYEIDKPEDQIKASGKEYTAPQAIKFYAEGGQVGRHPAMGHDDFHAFPEQNGMAQRHLTMRHGDDEHKHVAPKKAVVVHKNTGTMRYEMSMNKKAK